jgi:hypothetical protein
MIVSGCSPLGLFDPWIPQPAVGRIVMRYTANGMFCSWRVFDGAGSARMTPLNEVIGPYFVFVCPNVVNLRP